MFTSTQRNLDDLKFTCRRLRSCRAKLSASDLQRAEKSGDLICKPGRCPTGKYREESDLIQLQVELRKNREELRNEKRAKEKLLQRVEQLQDQLQTALDIRDIEVAEQIVAQINGSRSETVPVLLCSDWHCGAMVDPATVCDLNSYDLDEYHRRVQALFRNALRVVNMLRSTSDVRQMVVWLGGDLIDNWLHPDQAETQILSPTQQLIECERSIVQGLEFLLAEAQLERIVIPCSFGNHGRTTDKMRSTNAAATSYEWLMYQSLRRHFAHEPRLDFRISDGNVLYLDVLDKTLRFHHGDAVRYGGGVGGIAVPLQKWLYRQDVGIRADHTFLGHFHQLTVGPNFGVNGSLIGPTAYGLKIGFAPERPQQLMRCIDSERGFTISAPILTDDDGSPHRRHNPDQQETEPEELPEVDP